MALSIPLSPKPAPGKPANPGALYAQSEAQAVVDALNALIDQLRAAGVLT